MIGLGAAMVTQTLTFAQAFSAFATEIPWCGSHRNAHACALLAALTPLFSAG